MTIETDSGDAAAIINSTEELTGAYPDVVRTVVPAGWSERLHDLEEFAEAPRRKRGTVALQTTESLARYINDHRSRGTTVYADPDRLSIVAVLDDHLPSRAPEGAPASDDPLPGHRVHRATLTLQKTPGCKRWFDIDGKFLDQESFAQIVEDGQTEIARPSGADLLELAQTLQSTSTVEFRSGIHLPSGQTQFQYVETGGARAGTTGQLEIPETITLVIEPFFGAQPFQVDARLRYRILDQKLRLGIWLIRGAETFRQAFLDEIDRLTELTGESGVEGEGVVSLIGTP